MFQHLLVSAYISFHVYTRFIQIQKWVVVIQLVLIVIAEPKFASISGSINFVIPDRLHRWTQTQSDIILQETSLVWYKTNLTRTELKKILSHYSL